MSELVDLLLPMLAGAEFVSQEQRPWHSATFAGERLVILFRLRGTQCSRRAAIFAEQLPEAEFTLCRRLVADIVVSEIVDRPNGVELTVEALLLDD